MTDTGNTPSKGATYFIKWLNHPISAGLTLAAIVGAATAIFNYISTENLVIDVTLAASANFLPLDDQISKSINFPFEADDGSKNSARGYFRYEIKVTNSSKRTSLQDAFISISPPSGIDRFRRLPPRSGQNSPVILALSEAGGVRIPLLNAKESAPLSYDGHSTLMVHCSSLPRIFLRKPDWKLQLKVESIGRWPDDSDACQTVPVLEVQ